MRRALALSVTALILLVGCGDADKGDNGAAGLPKLPLATGDGRSTAEATGLGDSSAASAVLAPAFRIRYEAKGDLPDLRGPAAAHRAKADVDRSGVQRLAAAFGLKGDPEKVDETSWWLADGRVILSVSTQSMGEWSLGEAPEGCPVPRPGTVVGCATAEPTIALDQGTPREPAIPPGLPSAAEAEKQARGLLEKAGVDVGDANASVSEPAPEGLTVSFELEVDGVPVVGLGPSVTFGAGGALRYASGSLAEFSEVGRYPLIGTEEGLRRLAEGYAGGGRDAHILGGPDAVEGDGGGSDGAPGSSPGYDPQPGEPEPEPEPPERVETVDGVEVVLLPASPGCPGQPLFLVPAYRFMVDGGEPGPVVGAVESRYLQSSGDSQVEGCPDDPRPEPMPAIRPNEPVSSPPSEDRPTKQ